MLKRQPPAQLELLVAGSVGQLVPADHILACVGRVLDLGWLHVEVAYCCAPGGGAFDGPKRAGGSMIATAGDRKGTTARPRPGTGWAAPFGAAWVT